MTADAEAADELWTHLYIDVVLALIEMGRPFDLDLVFRNAEFGVRWALEHEEDDPS